MSTYMGLPLPPGWALDLDPISGNLVLLTQHPPSFQCTAIEAGRHIARYWNIKTKDEENEQHRTTNQASRDTTVTQHPAGDSGRTQQATYHSGLAQQGAAALQGAIQRAGINYYSIGGSTNGGGGGGSTVMTYYVGGGHGPGLSQGPGGYSTVEPAHPSTLPREAARIGEIVGHRAWRFTNGFLSSAMMMDVVWYPGQTMKDGCPSNNFAAVSDHGSAGIWAFKNIYDLGGEFAPKYSPEYVYGTVWMWGTVIEHERGYRSQYASIRSLDYAASEGINLEALQKLYVKKP